MQESIIEIINRLGYLGVFALITIENIFPPIPSEIILSFGGFLTTCSNLNVWGVIAAATLGSVLGAIILYMVGRALSTERLERLAGSRLGRLLHLRKEDVGRAEGWFLRHGNRAVFFCRFVPIVRSLISLPAGVSRMKLLPFIGLTSAGTLIWNMALVFLGRLAGSAWESMLRYVDLYSMIALAFIGLIGVYVLSIFIKRRF